MSFLEPYIAAYGALALFVIVYFESFGAPLPGESALIASSLLALHGTLNIEAVLIAGSMKINPLHFLAANIVGAAGWTLVWGLGPYMLSGILAPYVTQLKTLF